MGFDDVAIYNRLHNHHLQQLVRIRECLDWNRYSCIIYQW